VTLITDRNSVFPTHQWLSGCGSGRIFDLLVLTRLTPIPGSLSVQAGLLVSIIAFESQLLGWIMPQFEDAVK